jgi:hypothetical protein
MMDKLEAYKIWAPDDALWTQWAKPVLFMSRPQNTDIQMNLTELDWIRQMEVHTMIIVDLPGNDGVFESLALARMGYRPVPLYNGVRAPTTKAAIQVGDIVKALYKGAEILSTMPILKDAPPVFMLDSNRMSGSGKRQGYYDNRWCVFPQDMPSASYLIKEGIRKIIVRSDTIQNDLSHILRRYQDEGIIVYLCKDGQMEKLSVVKPSMYKSLAYRFKVILGLTRNGAGGFGALIPEATQTTSGTRYYGYG